MQRFLTRLWRLKEEVVERTAGPAQAQAGSGQRAESEGPARELLVKAHWAIDKVTRDVEGGFHLHTAIAAVMELVNDCYRLKDGLYGDPDGEAALRFATATAASLIFLFAPHLGDRGLRGADRRAGLGAALARGRSGAARARHLHARRPGQRQAPRSDRGGGRGRRAGAAGARPGERERAPPSRRQGGRQGDRGAGQARQPGRAVSASRRTGARARGDADRRRGRAGARQHLPWDSGRRQGDAGQAQAQRQRRDLRVHATCSVELLGRQRAAPGRRLALRSASAIAASSRTGSSSRARPRS